MIRFLTTDYGKVFVMLALVIFAVTKGGDFLFAKNSGPSSIDEPPTVTAQKVFQRACISEIETLATKFGMNEQRQSETLQTESKNVCFCLGAKFLFASPNLSEDQILAVAYEVDADRKAIQIMLRSERIMEGCFK